MSGNRLSSVPPLALVPASAVASVNNEEEEEEDGDSKEGEEEERRVSRLRELDLSRNDISVLVRGKNIFDFFVKWTYCCEKKRQKIVLS